jgi:hypothetical protein
MTLLLPSDAFLICSSQWRGINTCPAAWSAATLSSSVDDRLTVAAPLNRPPLKRLCRPVLLLPLLPLLLLVSSRTWTVPLLGSLLLLLLLPDGPTAWTCEHATMHMVLQFIR